MAVAGSANAEIQASNLSGRWTQRVSDAGRPCPGAGCRLTYDLVPCGDGWCGIEVKGGKECGRVALRLTAGPAHPSGVEFSGRYERSEGAEPYVVKANLYSTSRQQPPKDQLTLSIHGNTGGTFEAYRRTFPLNMVLVREGEPACRADPKLS